MPSLLLLLIFAGGVLLPQEVRAEGKPWWSYGGLDLLTFAGKGAASAGGEAIGWIFQQLLIAVLTVLVWATNAAAVLFSWTLETKTIYDLLQDQHIYDWWTMVRDVFNMFFILVLLLSAFSTIFQVDRYHYKKVLLSVILMALLVNFSFPIARFIIDFANRMMYFLLASSGISDGMTLMQVFTVESGAAKSLVPKDGTTATLIAAIIFMFILATALVTLALLMTVRLVALVLLVIFSPIGFVANILPDTSKYASNWWNMLFRYSFFGPFAMLMLVISMNIMKSLPGGSNDLTARISASAGAVSSSAVSQNMITQMALLAVPVILIYFTVSIGKSMSIAGADMAQTWGKRIAKYGTLAAPALWAAKVGAKAGGRMADRGLAKNPYTRLLSPTALKEAWKQNQVQKDQEAFGEATGKARETLNLITNPLKTFDAWRRKDKVALEAIKGDYGYRAFMATVAKEEKELASTEAKYLIPQLQAEMSKKTKNIARIHALMNAFAKENNLNDLAEAMGGEYGIDPDTETDPQGFQTMMRNMLERAGASGQQLEKQLLALDTTATHAGVGMAGWIDYNRKDGFHQVSAEGQAHTARLKFYNQQPQARQRTMHPNTIFTQGGDLHLGGLEIMSNLEAGDLKHDKETRGDFTDQLRGKMHSIFNDTPDRYRLDKEGKRVHKYERLENLYNNNANFKQYVDEKLSIQNGKLPDGPIIDTSGNVGAARDARDRGNK